MAFLIVQYVLFQASLQRIPQTWTVAGLPVGGQPIDAALDAVDQALRTPLTVRYRDQTLLLDPADVELRLDREGSRARIARALADEQRPSGFVRFLFRQPPPPP